MAKKKIKQQVIGVTNKGKVGLSQSANRISSLDEKYLVFCLKWLDIDKKKIDKKEKSALFAKMHQLSLLSWKEIRVSGKHQYGYEKIPISSLSGVKKPKELFTEDVNQADVFRYYGQKAMIGLLLPMDEFIVYYIIHLDSSFGAYTH